MRSTENLKKSEMPISTVPNSDEPIPAVIDTTVQNEDDEDEAEDKAKK